MSVKDALPTVRSGFTAGVRAAARTSERTDSQGNGPGADAREPTRPTADEAAKASRRGTDGLSHTRGPGCLTAEGGGGRPHAACTPHTRPEGRARGHGAPLAGDANALGSDGGGGRTNS